MGVPKFFRYISERYPCLSELVRENQVPDFDNLYLDMNGIIHNCSHPNDNDVHFRITEEQIFKDIFFYLETLFNMIKPQKLFFMAVDGVAPRAKMNQQRGRRFRSAKEAEVQEQKAREKGETLPTEARFDSNCITPGTPFMCRLNTALRYFIQHKISTSAAWRNCKVILSGHETPGEGEHKIMEYIRWQKAQKGFDPNTRHCLYGLDADLIMLGLCTHERHFSLLREEVKFGKNNTKAVSVSHQRFFLLHLGLMRDYLEQEFIALKDNMKLKFDIEKIIDDWVLMGFLVGNDFIPNIPNLHINTNALPVLYEAYIKTMRNSDNYINNGGTLNLKTLEAYLKNLAEFDRDHFSSHYDDLKFLESKHAGAFNERNDDTFGGNQDLMDMVKATQFEFDSPDEGDDSDEEKEDLGFEKEFEMHRRDYYVNKMKYPEMTEEVLKEQAECYIRALQWTLSYYYHGVQSWSWYYPHHYAPFISDLKNISKFDIKFDMSKPFLPFQQLMSVLPAGSRAHVPECYKPLMTSPDSELIDYYPQNFETDLNGKKQEWEAVVLIPFIDENRLLKSLEKKDGELSPDEKARNVHGPMYVYEYSRTSQGQLEGPLSFPSIGNVMCTEKQVFREEIQIPLDRLVLGPSKGAFKDVYFTGFPTFKHLKYTSKLRNQAVKVFDQPSRGESMIIIVDPGQSVEKPLEQLASEFLGKWVHVGWPHLMEAKVIKVSDKNKTISENCSDKTDERQWNMDLQSIKDHHSGRMGIDVGEITKIVHVLLVTGEDYKLNQSKKTFSLSKTYNNHPLAYPVQCVVKDVRSYRENYPAEVPIFEALKNGTDVFMLSNPYYGARGEVTDVACFEKSGRVKVLLTVPTEPDFSSVQNLHGKSQDSYSNSYYTATTLGISENVFNRVTGTVLVMNGSRRQVSNDESKVNIGLQLKFPKANEELAGWSKKDRVWFYSEKVIHLVQEYYCKFPAVFEVLGRKSGGNDIFFESDLFEDAGQLKELTKWLSTLPHQKAQRRPVGSESVEKDVVEMIRAKVNESKDRPMKKITMQVKPHLLYAPILAKGTKQAPDPSADFQLFDRVVVVRETEKFVTGCKGTVVGISKVKDANSVRRECIDREDVFCDIIFDDPSEQVRMPVENLINISFGGPGSQKITPDVKATAPPKREPAAKPMNSSYSAIFQNPSKKPDADKTKQNFADMWNALKQTGVGASPVLALKPSHLEGMMNEVKITNTVKEIPQIVAPKSLPAPPLAWLAREPQQKVQEQPHPGFVHPTPVRPMNGERFQPMPGNGFFNNNNNNFNVFPERNQGFPPPPQPTAFFHNNGGHFNPNPNYNRQRPMNYNTQPRPQYVNNQPNFTNNHNNFGNNQQNSQPQANPFVPLQASRKATKGKNNDTPKVQNPPFQAPAVAAEAPREQPAATPAQLPTAAKKPAKSTTPTKPKSRLAINFGK